MKLSGKVALVTGAGTGIGKGIAIELAKQGAKVAVHYNSSDTGAIDTKNTITAFGGEAMIVQANVSHSSDITRMMRQVTEHLGGLDILVTNAALQLNRDYFAYEQQDYDLMMNTNVKGCFQCIQAAVPYLKNSKAGRVIIISSVHAKRPTDFDPVYAMTKGAVRMLGRESAIELAQLGITVNTIEPGTVDVGKFGKPSKDLTPEEQAQAQRAFKRKYPLGRVGVPHDVARIVSFLAEDGSDYMNGSAIRLDGGSMLL